MAVQAPPKQTRKDGKQTASPGPQDIWDAFRRWGYLEADLDPLGTLSPYKVPELELSGPEAEKARTVYSGTIGVEFTHIADPQRQSPTKNRFCSNWCVASSSSRCCRHATSARNATRLKD